jgi:fatty acid-binding protein DegV
MRKIAISTDSGTILPEEAEKYGFSMIPVPIIIEQELSGHRG